MSDIRQGPLSGLRVVEFGSAITASWAAGILADQGAEVVKIEPPGMGDILRYVGAQRNGITSLFQIANRGKKSVALDIRDTEVLAVVKQLVARADVLIHNCRPGVMERLGLGYEACADLNPELIHVAISGFGDKGPLANRRAYDNVIQAFSGIAMSQARLDTGEPIQIYQLFADKITALTAAQAVTAALVARRNGAGGQEVKLSMTEACASFLWMDGSGTAGFLEEGADPGVTIARGVPLIEFADGYGQAAPLTDAEFHGFCRAFGMDTVEDPRLCNLMARLENQNYVEETMAKIMAKARVTTTIDAMHLMEQEDVPCAPAMNVEDLPEHPQMVAMDSFVSSVHPVAGRIVQPRNVPRFSGTPTADPGHCPGLGEHTASVLAELGAELSLQEWRERGVAG